MLPLVCSSLIISLNLVNLADGREGIEGTDYYYDRAKGVNVSCASKCAPPSSYPFLCAEKCYGYIPKIVYEEIEASPSDRNLSNLQWIIPVVVLVAVLLIILLACIYRRKLHILKEMYCEHLVEAVPETQNGAVRSEMPNPVNGPLLQDQETVVYIAYND